MADTGKAYRDTVRQVAAVRENRLAELRAALEQIAKQKLPEELEAEYGDHEGFGPDYEHGYEQIIKIARTALVPSTEREAQ